MDVPLDGTLIVAQGQTQSPLSIQQAQPAVSQKTEGEKRAILDSYLADGTITEDDLDNEFIVSSLTGSYLEQDPAGGGRFSKQMSPAPALRARAAIALTRTAASLPK